MEALLRANTVHSDGRLSQLFSRGGPLLDVTLIALFSVPTLFMKLGDLPLVLWDESRLANNAIEMSQNGFSLVTTYLGQPDLWNTKPPLLIWLITLSFNVFGVSEWSLRLPSALASLATALLVYQFCRRVTGSRPAGLGAALILLTTYGYVAPHVARTGDYDALMVLFTTTLVASCYALIERLRRNEDLPLPLLGCAVLGLTGAILTKGVAGLLIAPGIAAAATYRGVLMRAFRSGRLWAAISLSAAIVAAYYGMREVFEPGYLTAVSSNELGSRFSSPLEGHEESSLFYALGLLMPWGRMPNNLYLASAFPWSWVALGLLLIPMNDDRCKAASRYIGIVLAAFLLVISAAQTKIGWYAAPLYPLLACFTAIRAHAVFGAGQVSAHFTKARLPALAIVGIVSAVLATRIAERHRDVLVIASSRDDMAAAALLQSVRAELSPSQTLRIIKTPAAERPTAGPKEYAPQEQFYTALLRSRGFDARIVPLDYKPERQDVWVWCGSEEPANGRSVDRIILAVGNCRARAVVGGAQ